MGVMCRLFGHKPEVTHTNQHQIPTVEKCARCGLTRKMQRVNETNCYQWIYSDGRQSIGLVAFKIDEIKFGELS